MNAPVTQYFLILEPRLSSPLFQASKNLNFVHASTLCSQHSIRLTNLINSQSSRQERAFLGICCERDELMQQHVASGPPPTLLHHRNQPDLIPTPVTFTSSSGFPECHYSAADYSWPYIEMSLQTQFHGAAVVTGAGSGMLQALPKSRYHLRPRG